MKRRQSDQIRLESWKAIANYLHRSVRTVRRWEANEHLPVYRHRHKKGASVYAYKSELDAWQHDHHKVLPPALADAPKRRQRWSFVQIGQNVTIVLAAFAAGIVAGSNLSDRPAPVVEQLSGAESALASMSVPQGSLLFLPTASSPLSDGDYWSERVAQVASMPVLLAWVEGRVKDALQESHKLRAQLPNLPAATQSHVIDHLIDVSLAMGRVDDARSIAAEVEDRDRWYELQVKILFASGDKEGMRVHLQNGANFRNESTALFMAMAGLVDKAIEHESALGSMQSRSGRSDLILAMAAMGAGDKIEAKSRLQTAATTLGEFDLGFYFVAVDTLSAVLNSEGHLADAIEVLENTTPRLDIAASNNSGLFWLMCQRQLAALYRQAERNGDAEKIEKALRKRLTLADDSFPLARSLTDV